MTETNATVTKPLFATIGAGDALYATVNDIVAQVRERATTAEVQSRVEDARERWAAMPADVQAQFESLRERLAGLPAELPDDIAELREKFTGDELRALAEKYYRQTLDTYADLAERGAETLERLRSNQRVDERIGQVETLYDDAVHRAEDVVDLINGLLGRPVETDDAPIVEAEVVEVTTESTPVSAGNGASTKVAAEETVAEETTAEETAADEPAATEAPTKKAPPKKA
ncbi:heparin-binding hemagglutinin [Nocardia sp. CNY236]|uniref:heparin-binding hemagglutinin n=1 Tax=Nocardia sp. CNY236 TaxID=1169152 RepID=UPI0004175575|nr:heparin-binding hemagglutinin [Nocardia sp. CNY236]